LREDPAGPLPRPSPEGGSPPPRPSGRALMCGWQSCRFPQLYQQVQRLAYPLTDVIIRKNETIRHGPLLVKCHLQIPVRSGNCANHHCWPARARSWCQTACKPAGGGWMPGTAGAAVTVVARLCCGAKDPAGVGMRPPSISACAHVRSVGSVSSRGEPVAPSKRPSACRGKARGTARSCRQMASAFLLSWRIKPVDRS
jgi:hypothetical protein